MTRHEVLGWLVDAVLAFAVIESLVLLALRRAGSRGLAPREFALNMAAGLALMLALRAVVHDAGLMWVCLCLLGAGAAHLADLSLRWRRQGDPAPERLLPRGDDRRQTA